jgi:hypothetical protein
VSVGFAESATDTQPAREAREKLAPKAKTKIKVSAQVDWASKYVFRGVNRGDDAVLQSSLQVNYGRLSGSIWGNVDLSRTNVYYGTSDGFARVTEYRSSLKYTAPTPTGNLSLGVTHFDFANTGRPSTTEVWGKANLRGPFAPYVAAYFDVDEGNGAYVELGAGRFLAFDPSGFGVHFSGSIGYGTSNFNSFTYGVSKAGLTDLGLRTTIIFPIDSKFSLTTFAGFSTYLNDDIRAGRTSTNFTFGTTIGIRF